MKYGNEQGILVAEESHLRNAAKRIIARWFDEVTEYDAYSTIGDISFRGSICSDYPFGVEGQGVNPCWDEIPGFTTFNRGLHGAPSYADVEAAGIRVACVCDLALVHKGMADTVIETMYRAPVLLMKRRFLERHRVRLVEVDAEAVIRCTTRPDALPLFGRSATEAAIRRAALFRAANWGK